MKQPGVRSITANISLTSAASEPTFLPKPASRASVSPLLFPAQSPDLPTTPHGPRPETRLLEALAARNPALSATGSSRNRPAAVARE